VSLPLVLSADAIVRVRNGELLVHTTASSLPAFRTASAMLVGWVLQFAQPADPTQLAAGLAPADRTAVLEVVDYLKRAGVLVAGGAGEAAQSPEAAQERSRQHLRLLARSAYDLACELQGLGAQAERLLSERTGTGVERRLMALLSAVDGLRGELQAVREATLPPQLAALGIGPESRNLKLHIGCGKGLLEGWINIDVHPAPLSLNVLSGLPLAGGSASHVFVSHLLEHLHYPRDVAPFLAELRRVLAPGGRVRLVVPDIEQCIEAYVARDATFFASRRETWPWWPENPTRLEDFLAYAGVGPEPAYTFEAHKYGYDHETLARVLVAAGFSDVRRCGYMASPDPVLRVDDVSAVAKARYGERYYSLFVEATSPATASPKR
jgi:SAM-dependent methyltransferase